MSATSSFVVAALIEAVRLLAAKAPVLRLTADACPDGLGKANATVRSKSEAYDHA
jgi:hypothetical protein